MAGRVGCSGTVTTPHAGSQETALQDLGVLGHDGRALHRPELQGLADLAARLAGARAGAVDVQVGEEWHSLAGPGPDAREDLTVVAGVPLVTAAGVVLGELRVLDREVRALDAQVARELAVLAQAVVSTLEAAAAEARLFEAREAVARAEERLGQVAGQVSHDLNNPLAGMSMSLEIARDQVDEATAPLLASLLDRASGSAVRMKRMTSDLLAYGLEPVPGATDLQAEIEAVLAELDGLVPGRVEVQGPLPVVSGHPGDLRVVLFALLENAVKFARPEEQADVTVTATADGAQWRVTVADRGRGVPAEDLSRIFDPTVRLDKRVPGLGFGLATARRIVTAAGGSIGAEQGPEGGLTVWFSLPAAPDRGNDTPD